MNRFIADSNFSGKDLFEWAKSGLHLSGSVVNVDDTVIDKPYGNKDATELVDLFWSGLHHKCVKGINLIMLNYTDVHGVALPVNWRVYCHWDNKTKNDYIQDMIGEVFSWGLRPAWSQQMPGTAR